MKMGVGFGIWNARGLYRAGSLTTVVKVRPKVGIGGGTEPTSLYIFFYGKVLDNIELGTDIFLAYSYNHISSQMG
jgi:uncharacterized protein YuzE